MKTLQILAAILFLSFSRAAGAQPTAASVRINPATGLPGGRVLVINPATGLPEDASHRFDLPTLAPGEKPDLLKTLDDASTLTSQGEYENALQHYLWYCGHAFDCAEGLKGINLSQAFSGWIDLASQYPKAKTALIDIRDRYTQALLSGQGFPMSFHIVYDINRFLGNETQTYSLFKSIEGQDPQLVRACYFEMEGILVQKGEYQTCRKYIGDPQNRLVMIQKIYETWMRSANHLEESHQKLVKTISDINRQYGGTTASLRAPPDLSTWEKKIYVDQYVRQVGRLIEILVGTRDKADAQNIQKQALVFLDDPRLRNAVSDAEAKVGQTQ
jgi:hypothetical protein